MNVVLGAGSGFLLGVCIAMLINNLWGEGVVAVMAMVVALPLVVLVEIRDRRERKEHEGI